jgi:3',5'-cyclic AMP phosphodiesterase CpdA
MSRWFGVVLLATARGCMPDVAGVGWLLGAREQIPERTAGLELVARIAHVTDTHVLDEESPARFAGAHVLTPTAWRPQEACSAQLLDGVIRTVNRIHADGREIDLLIHTGDACDNAQGNELEWFLAVLDGGPIDPRSGPDDRATDARPEPALDPHAPFVAQGLYRAGVQGEQRSIPWYTVLGNHDVFAVGIFPIHEGADGHRTAALPLDCRPGLFLPVRFDPVAALAYGNVTPAEPGPPPLLTRPRAVAPKAARAYFSKAEFIAALFTTAGSPPGHGFANAGGASWYSVSPATGLRLIGLDTTDFAYVTPGLYYVEGAVSFRQAEFLRAALAAAEAADELVIVASHHSSASLPPGFGVEVDGAGLRALLSEYSNVVLHLAGHRHINRVVDRGGYLEIETCSTLDAPQEGRLIEIWRDAADGSIVIGYEMFGHLDHELPPLGDDPLRELRAAAYALAQGGKAAARQQVQSGDAAMPPEQPTDRQGWFICRP